MKKLFLVMAVASLGFVACNNESETTTTEDTATTNSDTLNVAPPTTPDTATVGKDSVGAATDTLKK